MVAPILPPIFGARSSLSVVVPVRQVLSAVVNIADDVRWGRVEETYGEDPYLASAMAATYVESLERSGVVATPKHFVANVGEGGRDKRPRGSLLCSYSTVMHHQSAVIVHNYSFV